MREGERERKKERKKERKSKRREEKSKRKKEKVRKKRREREREERWGERECFGSVWFGLFLTAYHLFMGYLRSKFHWFKKIFIITEKKREKNRRIGREKRRGERERFSVVYSFNGISTLYGLPPWRLGLKNTPTVSLQKLKTNSQRVT